MFDYKKIKKEIEKEIEKNEIIDTHKVIYNPFNIENTPIDWKSIDKIVENSLIVDKFTIDKNIEINDEYADLPEQGAEILQQFLNYTHNEPECGIDFENLDFSGEIKYNREYFNEKYPNFDDNVVDCLVKFCENKIVNERKNFFS